jgi:hypothetical protein
MAIPARLYKYRPKNDTTEKIIRENKLWFSSCLDFNDPFEGRIFPDFSGTKEDHRNFLMAMYSKYGLSAGDLDDKVQKIIDQGILTDPDKVARFSERTTELIMDRVSTLCFSGTNDSILEWSHYADNHRGICLEFSTSDPNSYFSKVQKVDYVEDYPILRIFSDTQEEQIKKFILTKSNHWFYEDEWRVLEIMGDGFTRSPGFYDFPPASLTGVIFGLRMTDDQIREILPWFEARDPKPELYRAGVKDRAFGVQIDPLDI